MSGRSTARPRHRTSVSMQRKGPTLNVPIHVRWTWRPFPTGLRMGPHREPAEHVWAWPVGDPEGALLEEA
eukprot:1408125-Pyramimonas_sp.AAC.1